MKRLIKITGCIDCPYCYWVDDVSESNSSGSNNCEKLDRIISFDDKRPKTPKWCPLSKK